MAARFLRGGGSVDFEALNTRQPVALAPSAGPYDIGDPSDGENDPEEAFLVAASDSIAPNALAPHESDVVHVAPNLPADALFWATAEAEPEVGVAMPSTMSESARRRGVPLAWAAKFAEAEALGALQIDEDKLQPPVPPKAPIEIDCAEKEAALDLLSSAATEEQRFAVVTVQDSEARNDQITAGPTGGWMTVCSGIDGVTAQSIAFATPGAVVDGRYWAGCSNGPICHAGRTYAVLLPKAPNSEGIFLSGFKDPSQIFDVTASVDAGCEMGGAK